MDRCLRRNGEVKIYWISPCSSENARRRSTFPKSSANSSFGGFQLGLCILCGLCLIMDGFDVQAMGYVAPVILKEWHVPNAQFGPVFGAGLFGILVGSLLFSMLADKIGRRPVLIAVTLCFSVLTFLTAQRGERAADAGDPLPRRNWRWAPSCRTRSHWWANTARADCASPS